LSVTSRNHRSTRLSPELDVGIKCRWKRDHPDLATTRSEQSDWQLERVNCSSVEQRT
jgi:hypothetical protein